MIGAKMHQVMLEIQLHMQAKIHHHMQAKAKTSNVLQLHMMLEIHLHWPKIPQNLGPKAKTNQVHWPKAKAKMPQDFGPHT